MSFGPENPYAHPPAPPPGTPPPPRPRIDRALLRPRTIWYWVAGAVLVAGVTASAFVLVSTVRTFTGPVTSFTAPAGVTLRLERGEGRTIYLQTRGAEGIAPASEPTAEDLDCSVRGSRGDRPVPESSIGGFTLTRGSDAYVARLHFEAGRGGTYAIRCRHRADPARRIPLAVGPRLRVLRLVAGILGGLGAFFGGTAAAVLIAGLTALLRENRRSRLEREAAAAVSAAPAPPGTPRA